VPSKNQTSRKNKKTADPQRGKKKAGTKTRSERKKAKTPRRKPAPLKPARKKTGVPEKEKTRAGNLPERLKKAALKILDDRKAEQIVVIDVRGRSILTDYIIIASGRSAKQITAIADYLNREMSDLGASKVRIEGLPQGDWVIVDAGDVLVHLFRPEVRRYYSLETIWNYSPGD